MATTAPAPPETQTPAHAKQQFLEVFDREHATTLRVLRAFPTNQVDLKPHRLCKTARELAWMFVMEQGLAEKALTTGLDWSKPSKMPSAPESFDEIIGAFDAGHNKVANLVRNLPDNKVADTVQFFTAPKTISDVPLMNFLWMLLHDQIHHRGQFSIYLRMADGKVPSIYGPTADEPWM